MPRKINNRGFTLVELVAVIILISLVYALAFSKFGVMHQNKKIKLENIKTHLSRMQNENELIEYIVYDKCSISELYINGKKQTKSIDFGISKDSETYVMNRYGSITKIENKNCFYFALYPNGSSSNFIIKNNNNFYVFYPYFREPNKTTTLDKAISLYFNEPLYPITISEYYHAI